MPLDSRVRWFQTIGDRPEEDFGCDLEGVDQQQAKDYIRQTCNYVRADFPSVDVNLRIFRKFDQKVTSLEVEAALSDGTVIVHRWVIERACHVEGCPEVSVATEKKARVCDTHRTPKKEKAT
ncbi:hypothetical protein G4H71_14460 [Rhodococcus triatomae]|uniref:Uncharacterized protein n=1 Tax=Rhodococcus triatomae TaxID=300028 RepID=A0A1G8NIV8_9NOCA|nr:hypothetical protein [Rhodococcus triatomae]QNG20016.1 hypothetical protein G4H72_15915 [Rhodococcus triatomae]QNG24068.1 hypothetical protein G4H71_14460 [Rhodococcus triatomae]SDI80133.1 hypothetical protein SAMN05444695_11183 [Rhodococcus triatomae]